MSNPHEIRTVKCAHCASVRQEATHWFVAAVENGRFRCRPMAATTSLDGRSSALGDRLKRSEQPVCGQECAQKLFDRYLASEMALRRH